MGRGGLGRNALKAEKVFALAAIASSHLSLDSQYPLSVNARPPNIAMEYLKSSRDEVQILWRTHKKNVGSKCYARPKMTLSSSSVRTPPSGNAP